MTCETTIQPKDQASISNCVSLCVPPLTNQPLLPLFLEVATSSEFVATRQSMDISNLSICMRCWV